MADGKKSPISPVAYQRPVNGRLVVRLEDGEEWDATQGDLGRFGFTSAGAAYIAFDDVFTKMVGRRDPTDSPLNAVRYLAEVALMYPNLMDHPESEGVWRQIEALDAFLEGHRAEVDELLERARGDSGAAE